MRVSSFFLFPPVSIRFLPLASCTYPVVLMIFPVFRTIGIEEKREAAKKEDEKREEVNKKERRQYSLKKKGSALTLLT